MTDKELIEKMAEEYAEYNQGKYTNEFGNLYHAHLAGLKAGSQLDVVWHDYDAGEDCYEDSHEGRWVKREIGEPKWHDLRKDPKDLPDTDRNVWVKRESETECQIDNYYEDDKGWGIMFREGYCTDDVIAWCELPIYEEETKPNTAQEIINKPVTLDIKSDGFGK